MMNKTQLLYDSYISYAVNAVKQMEIEQVEHQLAKMECFELSKKYLRKKKRIVHKTEMTQAWKTQWLPLKRVAMVTVLFFASITFLFAPVQAVQQAVIDTVIEWYDDFTRIVFNNGVSNTLAPLGSVEVGYWPAEYDDVRMNEMLPFSYTYICKNGSQDLTGLKIVKIEKDYELSMDNEYIGYEHFDFNGKNALLGIGINNTNILVWTERDFLVRISSPENINEIVKIAENVKI